MAVPNNTNLDSGLASSLQAQTSYIPNLRDQRLWQATNMNSGVTPTNYGSGTWDVSPAASTGVQTAAPRYDFSGLVGKAQQTPLSGGTGSTGGDTGLFGLKDTTWGNIGMAGQLGLGLANTITAMDQLNLQKEAFGFNKDMKNKEYSMAKDAYDRNVARAASIGEQMRKGQVS